MSSDGIKRIVLADRQHKERSVSLRDAQGFGLCSTGLAARAEEAAVDARGLQSLIAEHASAVGVGKRHHDHVAALDGAHVGADGLDHADRLVAHAAARFGWAPARCKARDRCRRCRRG